MYVIKHENKLLLNKILDKAKVANTRNTVTHTDFLDLNEQSIFLSNKKILPNLTYLLIGGYETAERKIIIFSSNYIEATFMEIVVNLRISPRHSKYASTLSHRDYLGAILSLGINRNKIGDIIVNNQNAYLFTTKIIADYILSHLTTVKRTAINIELIDKLPEYMTNSEFKLIKGTVSSIRLDSIISIALGISRGKSNELIKANRIFVNSKIIISSSYKPCEGDLVSIRGIGKFKFDNIGNTTKKNRIYIEIKKYI